jgi:hypothetical protein
MRFVISRVCDGGDCAEYCCLLICDTVWFGRTCEGVFGVTDCSRVQVGKELSSNMVQYTDFISAFVVFRLSRGLMVHVWV